MPRPATGELRPLANGWEARVRIEGKTRKGFALLASLSAEDAASRCRAMASMAQRLRTTGNVADTHELLKLAATVRPGPGWDAVVTAVDAVCGGSAPHIDKRASVTFGELANDWTGGKLHTQYPDHVDAKRTSDGDAARLKKWIFPVAEHIPLHAFTIAHAQEILRRIPATKSRATRRHVAQLMTRICNLAAYPCEHIERSPLPRGFLPRVGKGKALAYLYPDEDRKLLACVGTGEEPGVPLLERIFYGLLAREGLRCEEALSMTWAQVDLKRGSVRVDVNKTDEPRTWALDPGVVRALQWLKDQRPDDESSDRIFRDLEKAYHMAATFRTHLKRAGVDRAELFERSDARRPIRIHDLRATFITVNLANGKTEAWIADRTAHTTSTMINRYRRASRTHAELGQGTLAPLDEALGLPQQRPTAVSSGGTSGRGGSDTPEECAISAEGRSSVASFDSSYEGSNPSVGTAFCALRPVSVSVLRASRMGRPFRSRDQPVLALVAVLAAGCSRRGPPNQDTHVAVEAAASTTPRSSIHPMKSFPTFVRPAREPRMPKMMSTEHHLLRFKVLVIDPSGAGRATRFLAAIRERLAGDLSTPPSSFSLGDPLLQVHHMTIHAGQKIRDLFLEWELYGAEGELTSPQANVLFLGTAGVLCLGPDDGSAEQVSRDIESIQNQLAAKSATPDVPPAVLGHDVVLVVRSPGAHAAPLASFGFPVISEEEGALVNLQSLQRAVLTGM